MNRKLTVHAPPRKAGTDLVRSAVAITTAQAGAGCAGNVSHDRKGNKGKSARENHGGLSLLFFKPRVASGGSETATTAASGALHFRIEPK